MVLAEQDLIGGTCLNRGCIPTKALLESARLARQIARASEFGLVVDGARPDPGVMAARSKSIVSLMRKGVEDLLAARKVTVVRGRARLASAGRVQIGSGSAIQMVEAGAIIIAPGSSWASVPGVEVDGDRVVTSDDVLELRRPAGAMVIVGGGAVGCEIAEIYSALGSRVTIVEMMDHVLPSEDAEIARRLEAVLKRKGIAIVTSARVLGLEPAAGSLEVVLDGGRTLPADQVLVAVGRRPNVDDLGLEQAGVRFDRKGIAVDERLATGVPGVYAVGDVTGKSLLAHVATAQAAVAAENACGGQRTISYDAVPRCVYTDPEYAAVGLGESEATARGAQPFVCRLRLGRIGRAVTLGETFGLAKMVCDAPGGRILGFQALAPHASELVSEVGLAISQGLKAADVAAVIHPHPTLSEIVWEVAQAASGRPIHGD